MIIGVLKESFSGENRVALTPANIKSLGKNKYLNFCVEAGAGLASGIADTDYESAGAKIVSQSEVWSMADIICQVHTAGSNPSAAEAELSQIKAGQIVVGMADPLANPAFAQSIADKGATAIALELVPRITRAQAMDILSSNAMLAGYKSVLIAADNSKQMFPMNMTAAGTLSPAKVLVMGAGVAGLQACATAKRLGAVVSAYDIRPEAQEQILSVGAKPVELDLKAEKGEGGYAKEQSEDFIKRQQELMTEVMAQQDVIITTAAIPGRPSPILVTEDQVKAMKAGSVIVDLAAERGGNCALTQLGETVVAHDVTIVGPANLASDLPAHGSQMYGKNMENFLNLLISHEQTTADSLTMDFEDEIIQGTVMTYNGDVVNGRIRSLLDLPALDAE